MGGGMGGGMGGMGGGMRSVPPTGLPFASLKPGQTRNLPTRLVSLSAPDEAASVAMPAKGEKLRIGDIGQLTDDVRTQKALKRLAEDKAPVTLSQLVMWRIGGLGWNLIEERSKDWANVHELSLARRFVDQLDNLPQGESGALLYEINAGDSGQKTAANLTAVLKDKSILGLKSQSGIPAQPVGPAVACKIQVNASDAVIQVATSDGAAKNWTRVGKFTLPLSRVKGELDAATFADALAEGILDRLVRAQVSNGPVVKGKLTYKIKIENASPMILNGLAVLGSVTKSAEAPKVLTGISISPFRSLTVPATEEMVKTLGLKKGVKVIAADLSGL
jgi:hypothetical protein